MVSTITAVGVFEAVSLILAFTMVTIAAFSRVYPLAANTALFALRCWSALPGSPPAFVNEAACCNEAAPGSRLDSLLHARPSLFRRDERPRVHARIVALTASAGIA